MPTRSVFSFPATGWTVINVEYRLAKQAPAPAAVEDCRCALKWLADNASKYEINVDEVVVSGISAGGHLALTVAAVPDGTRSKLSCPNNAAIRIAGVVNWFGPSDITDLLTGPNRFASAVDWFRHSTDPAATARRISPLNYGDSGFPPVITIHGNEDETDPVYAIRTLS